jgi:hypothetical protein
VERNVEWPEEFAAQPYDAGWASEALFSYALRGPPPSGVGAGADLPGRHDVSDESATLLLGGDAAQTCARVRHCGGWLRLAGRLPPGDSAAVTVCLVLKE